MADTGIAIENRDKILNQARTINIYGQHNHDSSKPDTASELRAEQEKYHAAFLESLSFPEMSDRVRNIERPHHRTCNWLAEHPSVVQWTKAERGTLWIEGKPGAGKSTAMSFLENDYIANLADLKSADQAEADTPEILDFYFHARGTEELQRSAEGMLRSLLYQLFSKDLVARQCNFYQSTQKRYKQVILTEGVVWKLLELKNLFSDAMVAATASCEIVIFIDAIDEAGYEVANDLGVYFRNLTLEAKRRDARTKLCVSCRHYPSPVVKPEFWSVVIEEHNRNAIKVYVSEHLADLPAVQASDHDEWKDLIAAIVERSNGVFQWAKLVVPMVALLIGEGESPCFVEQQLKEIPAQLEEIYQHILTKVIRPRNKKRAFRMFCWLCFGLEPLSMTQLRYAIAAFDADSGRPCDKTSDFIDTDERMIRLGVTITGGLAELVGADEQDFRDYDKFQLVHESAREYLLSNGLSVLAEHIGGDLSVDALRGHSILFDVCLNYLLDVNAQQKELGMEMDTRSALKLTFFHYCERHLFEHLRLMGKDSLMAFSNRLADLEKVLPRLRVATYHRNYHPGVNFYHFAANIDFPDLIDFMHSRGIDGVDSKCGLGYTPLHLAVECGNVGAMSAFLVTKTVDLNSCNNIPSTVLMTAIYKIMFDVNGREVERLLQAGADPNISINEDDTLLLEAIRYGNASLVKLLLKYGAKFSKPKHISWAIMMLSDRCDLDLFKMVFERLPTVAYFECKPLVRLANRRMSFGGRSSENDPATREAECKFAEYLIRSRGADPNISDFDGYMPLVEAIRGGSGIVETLLNNGANVNLPNQNGETPLHVAAMLLSHVPLQYEYELLALGADPMAVTQNGATILHVAAAHNNIDAVELFLKMGVYANAEDRMGQTPLHLAAANNYEDVTRTLLQYGGNPNALDLHNRTPAHRAIYAGSEKALRQLLAKSPRRLRLDISDIYGVTVRDVIRREKPHYMESMPSDVPRDSQQESQVDNLVFRLNLFRLSQVLLTRRLDLILTNPEPVAITLRYICSRAAAYSVFNWKGLKCNNTSPTCHSVDPSFLILYEPRLHTCLPDLFNQHMCKDCRSYQDWGTDQVACRKNDKATANGWVFKDEKNSLGETEEEWVERIKATLTSIYSEE